MAAIRANRPGNFSDPTMWSSGTVPTAGDDVNTNNFLVTMDINATVLSLKNDASGGATQGGSFIFSVSGITVTLLGLAPLVTIFTPSLLVVSHTGGTVTLITSSAINATGNTGIGVIRHTGSGTFILTTPSVTPQSNGNSIVRSGNGPLIINSIITPIAVGAVSSTGIANTGAGPITINGGVGGGSTTSPSQGITNTNVSSTITVNGTVVGGANLAANYAINSTGPININGSATCNGTGNGILANGGLSMSGTVTCNGGGTVVSVTNASTVTVIGNVVYGNAGTGFGIEASTNAAATVTLAGNFTNRAGRQAIFCRLIFLSNTVTNQLTFNTPGGVARTLYSDDTFPNLPATTNVRLNTTYGPGSGNTGTLIVPSPATVLLGVPTDNTTGTLLMTPADFITELNTSTTAVAVRLQNCATVATTGDQVASYGV